MIFEILVVLFLFISIMIIYIKYNSDNNEIVEYKNVKYFFDNLESFNDDLPNSISKEIIVRGRIVQKEVNVACFIGPCDSEKVFFLEDVNDKNYSFMIYPVNMMGLETNKTYVLIGILEESPDRGKKIVYISNFKPKEILCSEYSFLRCVKPI